MPTSSSIKNKFDFPFSKRGYKKDRLTAPPPGERDILLQQIVAVRTLWILSYSARRANEERKKNPRVYSLALRSPRKVRSNMVDKCFRLSIDKVPTRAHLYTCKQIQRPIDDPCLAVGTEARLYRRIINKISP